MHNYLLTAQAISDINEIWKWIAERNSAAAANRVTSRFYEECQKLSEMPGIGHYRHELLSDRYRFWLIWSYLIVYRWNVLPIQIVAVVHGARDLQSLFDSRNDVSND